MVFTEEGDSRGVKAKEGAILLGGQPRAMVEATFLYVSLSCGSTGLLSPSMRSQDLTTSGPGSIAFYNISTVPGLAPFD